MRYGQNEGRLYKIDVPIDFNAIKYIEQHEDLLSLSRTDAEIHYMQYGKYEGRKYT